MASCANTGSTARINAPNRKANRFFMVNSFVIFSPQAVAAINSNAMYVSVRPRGVRITGIIVKPAPSVYITYSCHLCGKRSNYYLLLVGDNMRIKVGQFPAQSTSIPSTIEKRLGTSAIFYRRALTCRNEGYGLAAVGYFRRVVEDKRNELVDVVADSAEAMGMSEEDIAKIRAAKSQKVYEEKLKIASQAMPSTMKPDGANPLHALFELLSVGLHTQTEEECLQIADNVHEIFDYLFDSLRAEIEDREAFVAKVKQIVGKHR